MNGSNQLSALERLASVEPILGAFFCGRWEIGIEHLANDAQQVANRLFWSAQAYAKAENTVIAHLKGILQSRTGTDPAASQW